MNNKFKTIDRVREENRASKVYGHLPKHIRNDPDLSAGALVVVAYCTTFRDYQLRPERIAGIVGDKPGGKSAAGAKRKGLGRNTVYRYLQELKDRGYLRRPRKGSRVVDELGFTTNDRTPQIKRCWFDGSLSLNALAAFIWLKVNPGSFTRELAARFGWSRKTAQQALNELAEKGWIKEPRQERGAAGQFAATRYSALPERDRVTLAGGKTTGESFEEDIHNDSPGTEKASCDVLHKSSSKDAPPRSRLAPSDVYDDAQLLGWLNDDGNAYFKYLVDAVTDEDCQAITSLASLEEILNRVRAVTSRRITSNLANLRLAVAIVEIAAALLASADHPDVTDPETALAIVLDDIERRIGHQDGWLTSLKLIGQRVLGDKRTMGQPDAGAGDVDTGTRAELKQRIREVDVNNILAELLGDDRGLHALVRDYGEDAVADVVTGWLVNVLYGAEDTVSNVFTGCFVEVLDDGGPGALPETWSYFRPALDDERKKARMSEEGIRPGDVPNWREQPVH